MLFDIHIIRGTLKLRSLFKAHRVTRRAVFSGPYQEVMCVSNEDHTVVDFVTPPTGAVNGERVTFAGFEVGSGLPLPDMSPAHIDLLLSPLTV